MVAAKKRTTKREPERQLNETQRWVLGVTLLVFASFLFVAVISYYYYWSVDQNFVRWGDMWRADAGAVGNPAGKMGAIMANYVIGEWFGVFGVIIPISLIILALRIINFRPPRLRKSVRISLVIMILGSLSLGYIFGGQWGVFGSGLGGAHGIFVSQWSNSLIGSVGTALVLLLGWILIGIYINSRRTIAVVNRVGKGVYDAGGAVIEHASGVVGKRRERKVELYDGAEEEYYNQKHGVRQSDEEDDDYEDDEQDEDYGDDQARQEVDESTESPAVNDAFVIRDSRADEQAQMMAEQQRGVGFEVVSAEGANNNVGEEAQYAGGVGRYAGEVGGGAAVGASVGGAGAWGAQVGGVNAVGGGEQFAGGVGRYSDEGSYQSDTVRGYGERDDGPFQIIERPAENTPISVGGVVEAVVESGGITTEDKLEVVLAGRRDVEVEDDEVDASLYDPTKDLPSYRYPQAELLEDHTVAVDVTEQEIVYNKDQIVTTLENFGIKIDKIKATIGPTVTLYEIVPAAGIKISRIKNLEDDIALGLKALGIRIIAPMPGQGTVGIEVPNKDKEIVSMYSMVKTKKFRDCGYELPVVLGKTISNETYIIDLAKMPHLLVAGATGQGKSVGLNAIITSLLYKKHPAELKFVLVDPKRVELSMYSKLENHFLAKMESEDEAILTDTQKVVYTLNALCTEMSERYDLLRAASVKKISEYNDKFLNRRLSPKKGHKFMPYIVVVIDEFADMIMTAGREVETPITRLAQLARAVGIHLIIATQRPDVKVITGLIKANFPARVAFRVTSMVDSRTILDQPGANQLIGRGDMLMSINGEVTRVQCAFIDTPEIERLTEFIGNQKGYSGAYSLPDYYPDSGDGGKSSAADLGPIDPLFDEVARFIVQGQQGSTSSIQRRFSIGYNRAGRIMDQMEAEGIVGGADGSKPREVLLTDVQSLEYILGKLDS